jgi:hypothetical protein
MATFKGGQSVKGGYFVSVRDMKLEMVEAPFGTLPGDGDRTYRRVPVPAMLVLAPLLGLAFVLLLPFIGLAVVCEPIVRNLAAAYGRRHVHAPRPTTVPPR